MKRFVAALMLASMLSLGAVATARAQEATATSSYSDDSDYYEDAFSNPLRLAYYVIHPIGFTAEWLIMRPFHYIISRPYLNKFFGYEPIGDEVIYSRMGEHM
jgi:hypothetical protein